MKDSKKLLKTGNSKYLDDFFPDDLAEKMAEKNKNVPAKYNAELQKRAEKAEKEARYKQEKNQPEQKPRQQENISPKNEKERPRLLGKREQIQNRIPTPHSESNANKTTSDTNKISRLNEAANKLGSGSRVAENSHSQDKLPPVQQKHVTPKDNSTLPNIYSIRTTRYNGR